MADYIPSTKAEFNHRLIMSLHGEPEPEEVTESAPSFDGGVREPAPPPKPWENSRRRERMGLSGGAWETLRRRVLNRDQGLCYLCDRPGADEVDHLVDVGLGGSSDASNLASAHASCHRRRHRDPDWADARVEMALLALGGGG